jgi:hypothetical protein
MAVDEPVGKRTPAVMGVTTLVLVSLPMSSDAKCDSTAAIESPALQKTFFALVLYARDSVRLHVSTTGAMLRMGERKSCEAHPTWAVCTATLA